MTKANKCLQFLDIAKDIGMMMILWMHIWDNKPIEFTPEFINYFSNTNILFLNLLNNLRK